MIEDIESVLLSEEQIEKRITEMGEEITRAYKDKNPIFVGVLKGCFVFMADLMRSVESSARWTSCPFPPTAPERRPPAR
jgi:hypoxanthine phosphoribosyltransferase